MSTRTQVLVALGAVIVVALGVLAGVRLLGSDADDLGTDAHIQSDRSMSAEATAQDVIGAIFSWSPASQEGPWDSLPPIADRLTGPLAESAAERPANEPLPKQWLTWAEDNARIVGATELGESSGDDSHKSVEVVVKQRVMHADGDVTPLEDMIADVDMVRVGEEWKASRYEMKLPN